MWGYRGLFAAMFMLGAVMATGVAAQEPKLGDKNFDGRTFIFYQPVEIYGNNWSGIRVNDPASDQANVYIKGEGKTVDFDGVMSINCDSASGYFWLTGSFWGGETPATEQLYNENIPTEVIAGARQLFCGKS